MLLLLLSFLINFQNLKHQFSTPEKINCPFNILLLLFNVAKFQKTNSDENMNNLITYFN